jgi:hypothetical protein
LLYFLTIATAVSKPFTGKSIKTAGYVEPENLAWAGLSLTQRQSTHGNSSMESQK